jgi:hypothetical protein
MGHPLPFAQVKLISGILTSQPSVWDPLLEELSSAFGPIDYQSPGIPFTFTHYYDEEMGIPILRHFVSFRRLVSPCRISEIKLLTNDIENRFRRNGKRQVNIDPGFLCSSRLILATTKDGSHRIPLQDGIYAEVTLLFEKGDFRPLPWTYPDYRSRKYREILLAMRRLYKEEPKKTTGAAE